MMPNTDPSDSLREMLTKDASHLPAMAAHAAREHRHRRAQQRRRLGQATLLAILGICGWQSLQWIRSVPKVATGARNDIQQPAGASLVNVVMAQAADEITSTALPLPPGATDEQKALIESARGLPLLLVMDASGKPARIVVVER